MTDQQFENELWTRAWIDQIAGYPLGSPQRNQAFQPVVFPFASREEALDSPAYVNAFTPEERALLLQREA